MIRRHLTVVCLVLVAARASGAPTPRETYAAALTREKSVRNTLALAEAAPTVVREARAIVGAYQALVRQHPTSPYADNALWQGGRLAFDVFLRFHQAQDRTTAMRLLKTLTTAYPKSRLVKQASEQLARVSSLSTGGTALSSAGQARASITRTESRSTAPAPADRSGPTPAVSAPATLKSIRRTVLAETVRLVIEFDGEVSFRDERLQAPARVAVDLPSTHPAAALLDRTLRFDGDTGSARQVYVSQQANDTTRVVIDASGISSYSIYPLYGPYRLVIDCVRTPEPRSVAPPLPSRVLPVATVPALPTARPRSTALISEALRPPVVARLPARNLPSDWGRDLPEAAPQLTGLIATALTAPPPARLARRVIRNEWAHTLPAASPRAAGLIAEALADQDSSLHDAPKLAVAEETTVTPVPVPPDGAASAARRQSGGYSMARQLGLSVSRIVIDPGHGGHDPGAQGMSVDEAGLVLDVALRVEKLLQATPGTEVILTRRTNEFLSLAERTAIANRENADLFLSIHANASDKLTARGVETYFLNFAENMTAASVAARENAASGQSMAALPDLVKLIALNNKLDESRDFAAEVQRAMVDRLRVANKTVRDLGVKQAPFAVLIGAAMPSVLAEISFVTNAQEEKLLKSDAYRQRIAEALYSAVHNYQISLMTGGAKRTAVISPE